MKIDDFKKEWHNIIQLAIFIFTIIGFFLLQPPIGILDNDSWVNFSKFVVSGIIGLMFFPLVKYSNGKYAAIWWVLSVVLLIGGIIVFLSYQDMMQEKTISIRPEILEDTINGENIKFVIGDIFNDTTLNALQTELNRKITKGEFIEKYAEGDFIYDRIFSYWDEKEVKINSKKLNFIYLLSLSIFSMFLLTLIQSVKCQRRKKRNTKIVK